MLHTYSTHDYLFLFIHLIMHVRYQMSLAWSAVMDSLKKGQTVQRRSTSSWLMPGKHITQQIYCSGTIKLLYPKWLGTLSENQRSLFHTFIQCYSVDHNLKIGNSINAPHISNTYLWLYIQFTKYKLHGMLNVKYSTFYNTHLKLKRMHSWCNHLIWLFRIPY